MTTAANRVSEQGYSYAMSGQGAKAQKILRTLRELGKRKFVDPYGIAIIYLGLGKTDETLAWLEKVFHERSPNLPFLKVDPKFDRLRTNTRFHDLLRRAGIG